MMIHQIENSKKLNLDDFNILILLSGNITLRTENNEIHLYKKSYLFYNKACQITTASPYLDGYTLSLSEQLASKIIDPFLEPKIDLKYFNPTSIKDVDNKRMLLTSLLQNSKNEDLSKSYMHILFSQFLSDYQPQHTEESSLFHDFIELIDENIENNFCAGEYAKLLDIPIKELIKTVKGKVDKTPCNVITERVVESVKNK